MIKKLIFLVMLVAASIICINNYLNINDLSGCGETPDAGKNCQAVDAIVAISGGTTSARSDEAIKLYKNGWGGALIFSGAAVDKNGPSNALAMKQMAIAAGVPEDKIYIDEYADSTKQNAQNVQAILLKLNAKKIILVTSGYHQRRASLEFNKYSVGVTVINHSTTTDGDWTPFWWMFPRGWWLAITETIKVAMFYAFGV